MSTEQEHERRLLRNLLNDVCRCHGEGCLVREECLRYLGRDTAGDRTPFSANMLPVDLEPGERCPSQISP